MKRMMQGLLVAGAGLLLAACYPPTQRGTGVVYEDDPAVYNEPAADRVHYSDHEIHDHVHSALAADRYINEDGIQVHVEGGTVTLTGYVHSYEEAERAHDVAHSVRGVRTVVNRLTVT